jgi:branched-chain amino acid transport system ATP-binding protein
MLNVINGVYHPQQGRITYRGKVRSAMDPHHAAAQGFGRTFQSLALFKGMSVLDNIMTGRGLRMRTGLLAQAINIGPARREELRHSRVCREHYRFSRDPALPQDAGRPAAVRAAEARRPSPGAGDGTIDPLLDEPMAGMNLEEKQDMSRFVLDVNDEFGTTIVLIEHDMGVVMDISDRVVVLDYGRKIGDGTPDEVRGNEQVIAAYLGVAH